MNAEPLPTRTPAVAIIGGGPAGAAHLKSWEAGEVLVLEREAAAGGLPRHSDHPGYGIRDLQTFLSGPQYARRLVEAATAAGFTILTRATVTGWTGNRSFAVTSRQGRFTVEPRVVVLATGARERPRPARRIPGGRLLGVLTTGHLRNLVDLRHRGIGERAVVVGAELISWSAVLTLREAGCRTVS